MEEEASSGRRADRQRVCVSDETRGCVCVLSISTYHQTAMGNQQPTFRVEPDLSEAERRLLPLARAAHQCYSVRELMQKEK